MKTTLLRGVENNKPGREDFYVKEDDAGNFFLGYGWDGGPDKGFTHQVRISEEFYVRFLKEAIRQKSELIRRVT